MKNMRMFLLVIICIPFHAKAQSDWYKNMEKYWWYRYRLVNDFTKIGDKPGESLPGQKRCNNDFRSVPKDTNAIHWNDEGLSLGNYIGTLATEYRILENNNFSTRRTKEELYYALEAFDRLDRDAESYCADIDHAFPCNPNPSAGSLNGFFIRDDVPVRNGNSNANPNNIYSNSVNLNPDHQYKDFVDAHYAHFNRPGVVNLSTVKRVGNGSFKFRTPANEENCSPWPSGVPVYPVEESQDQVVDIFSGLGLTAKFLNGATYNGINLEQHAKDAAWRMISYISGSGAWTILNPLTGYCVYGVSPCNYFNLTACSDGGALFQINALPAAVAAQKISGNSSPAMYSSAQFFSLLFQAAQFFSPSFNKDVAFVDNFVAFARNWYFTIPLIGSYNTSWWRIRQHAKAADFASPHIPLIYRINYPWTKFAFPNTFYNYIGPGFDPKDGNANNPGYRELLNEAPSCGPFLYGSVYGNIEWSGTNRLAEPYHRYSGKSDSTEIDFNGVDYMFLYNLYNLVDTYSHFLINPYYMENYNINYPDANYYGSTAHALKLNWLEYLSAVNKINTNSNVTFHGCKKIDLLPGFESKAGSIFLVYIQDISCNNLNADTYHFAELSDYTEGNGWQTKAIEYNSCPGCAYNNNFPEPSVDAFTTFAEDHDFEDDIIDFGLDDLLKPERDNSQNPEPGTGSISNIKRQDNLMLSHENIALYPNPNNGTFNIQGTVNPEILFVEIEITDLLGRTLFKDIAEVKQGKINKNISFNNPIANGVFFAKIKTDNITKTIKFIINK